MREWLTFLAVVFGWAAAGNAVLSMKIAHPGAIAAVWFIGLIWLIGWTASSARDADHLLKVTLGFFVACGLLAAVVAVASS